MTNNKSIDSENCVYEYLIKLAELGDYFTEGGKLYRTYKRVGRGERELLDVPEEVGRESGNGYVMYGKRYGGVQRNIMVHRLIYALHHELPTIDSDLVINHKNGIKNDNRPDNLELVTNTENIRHALDTGLRRVENNNTAKLTWEKVGEIRELIQTGKYSDREIGDMYDVSKTSIRNIRICKTWVRRVN